MMMVARNAGAASAASATNDAKQNRAADARLVWDDPFADSFTSTAVDADADTDADANTDADASLVDPFGCFGDDDSDDHASAGRDGRYDEQEGEAAAAAAAAENAARSASSPAIGLHAAAASASHREQEKKEKDRGAPPPVKRRGEDCGVLSYHQGTEAAMLAHVRNAVADLSLPGAAADDDTGNTSASTSSATHANTDAEAAQCDWEGSSSDLASSTVLTAIDEFCTTRHWMMHVGPEKGRVVTESLRNAVEIKAAELVNVASSSKSSSSSGSFVCVELGTYCGYASVLLCRAIRAAEAALLKKKSDDGTNNTCNTPSPPPRITFRLYTVEVNPSYASVSRQLFKLAQLDDMITLVDIPVEVNMLDAHDAAADAVSDRIWKDEARIRQTACTRRSGGLLNTHHHEHQDGSVPVVVSRLPKIDYLFIDHDKDAYLSDLVRLEKEGLIRAGSICVADNVVFAGINDYLEYVKRLAREGYVRTETVYGRIEYADDDDEDEDEDEEEESDSDDDDHDDQDQQSLFLDGIGELSPLGGIIPFDTSNLWVFLYAALCDELTHNTTVPSIIVTTAQLHRKQKLRTFFAIHWPARKTGS
mmetsp:Transcript_12421/g.25653  ORF Transcript_12421/g.25653 Transcript_12421/m.25653 type:complete len:592 (+) Transcript_12421:149-1924(+)